MNRNATAFRTSLIAASLLAALGTSIPAARAASDAAPRPNILLILADDLGYSDLGAYGGEIDTPNLDRLAGEGRRLTNLRVNPTCSPTRSSLFSGTDHHLAGLGTMEGMQTPAQQGKPGYEGLLNERALSVAQLLRDGGYHTYIAGKWHLGPDAKHRPAARGFEESFVLLGGAASHFKDSGVMNAEYRENDSKVELPADFYSTDHHTDKLISFIDRHRGDGKPFFAFAAYTSPHWPLQVPGDSAEKYRGKYDAGYDAIRAQRIARQKALGIVKEGQDISPTLPATAELSDWNGLGDDARRYETRRMEIYAAMVDNLDRNIGRLLQHLKDIGEYDNTVIIFASDNGAEGHTVPGFVPPASDQSLANLGKPNSFVAYGQRWAEVGATPFRLVKGYTTEGGVRSPGIIRHPTLTHDRHDDADAVVTISDLAPTFLELAGITPPNDRYQGREVLPMTGRSLVPWLKGATAGVHPAGTVFADELFGHRYVRKDNWKIVWIAPPVGEGRWQLYDLTRDPGETRDLATTEPARLAELIDGWNDYVRANGVVLPDGPITYANELPRIQPPGGR